jgi:phospholipid/cholesterol/gamma-HCH transport system permease protein
MGIVIFISIFVGMVVALQMAFNIQDSPLLADYYIGYTTRESLILEFSPTMISLILAGKVGSSIASNLGTMRTTEQIDALEVMGVNSASYLVMPKIVAGVFFNPFLITLSIAFGILGGYFAGILTGMWSGTDYYIGITDEFRAYTVVYALIKTVFFAFLIASVAAYHGYHTKGGAIDVGRSSTQAVVFSSISIIVLNYFLTQIML